MDAILAVTLARSTPEKSYIIRPSRKKQTTEVSHSHSKEREKPKKGNPPTKQEEEDKIIITYEEEEGHGPVEVTGRRPWLRSRQTPSGEIIIASYAQAVVTGEMLYPATGEIIWAGSYSYEGVILESALSGAVRGLIRQIPFPKE